MPELEPAVTAYRAEWGGDAPPGPVNVIDEVLIPRALEWFGESGHRGLMHRFLDFVDELARDSDASIRELSQLIVNSLSTDENFCRYIKDKNGDVSVLLERSRMVGPTSS